MARVAGVDIPNEKKVPYSLRYIHGIGLTKAHEVLERAGVSPDIRVRDLTDTELDRLREIIDTSYRVEGDLRREVGLNLRRLSDIGSYRGLRHQRGLPVRGQRTRTNARLRKGNRRTVSGRRRTMTKK